MVGCSERCREEFRLKNFFLQHADPQIFVQFQFGQQRLYAIWRVFWAVYHTGWIIASGIRADLWAGDDTSQHIKWFIFLTNWSYFLLTVSTIVDACVVGYVFVKRKDIRRGYAENLPWYIRVAWCLNALGNTASVTITLAYWSIVYNGTQPMNAIELVTHVFNAVYVILNTCITGMPTRFLHFWFPVIFGFSYSLFSLFYYLAGGTNHNEHKYIYPALDWREPGTAILYCAVVSFIVVPVVHFILFGIHSLKMLIYDKNECCHPTPELEDVRDVELKQPGY